MELEELQDVLVDDNDNLHSPPLKKLRKTAASVVTPSPPEAETNSKDPPGVFPPMDIISFSSSVPTEIKSDEKSARRRYPLRVESSSINEAIKQEPIKNEENHEEEAVKQEDTKEVVEDQVDPKVKREQAEKKLLVAKENASKEYGHKVLLHRFEGINSLGGGRQHAYQRPSPSSEKVFVNGTLAPGYPLPKQARPEEGYDMDMFTCLCYNTLYQLNGPKFACQPTAAVSSVPDYMIEKNLVLPLFMKRSMTNRESKQEGKALGWEYVGNYRCISDPDVIIWQSHKNFWDVMKREIAEMHYKSATSGSDARNWRNRIEEAKYNDQELWERAQELEYRSDMNDKDLFNLLVEIDQFHGQQIIEFVEYDERIYEWCVKNGPTSKNSVGRTYVDGEGEIAKAQHWYDFGFQYNLM